MAEAVLRSPASGDPERRRNHLILDDVMLVLIEPTNQPIHGRGQKHWTAASVRWAYVSQGGHRYGPWIPPRFVKDAADHADC
jgi:hypothetical protein